MAPIQHPLFVDACAALRRALARAAPGELIFVTGMSGAGKSELRKLTLRDYAGPQETWGLGRIPAISVPATPSDQSHFHSKDFIGRWHDQLFAPRVDWLDGDSKVSRRYEQETLAAHQVKASLSRLEPERQIRRAVERLSRERSLRAAFIDEAGSMTYTTKGKPPGDHMVSYMCLAEEIPVVLVLFGVPRMRALWRGNAEIRRRAQMVFLQRYRPDSKEAFARLVATLGDGLPLETPSLLTDNLKLIYHGTVGVFGELKGFLARADESRLSGGRASIRLRDLEAAVYAKQELATLHADAVEFDRLSTPADLQPPTGRKCS